jgi:hypothetical protein
MPLRSIPRLALPEGFEAQVRPRSGLAAKHGSPWLNAPGTIDADYRGEIQVILINHGAEPFAIRRGERIAQMVIGAGGSGCAQSGRLAAGHGPRQRRLRFDRAPERSIRGQDTRQATLMIAFLHSEVSVHGLDSYPLSPLGDIFV